MKKFLIACFSLLVLSASVFGFELQVRLLPDFGFPISTKFDYILCGSGSIDFIPFSVRGRDDIYFSLQGGISSLRSSSIDPSPIYEGGIAVGYNFRIIDRLSVSAEASLLGYSVPDYKLYNEKTDENITFPGLSGFAVGGRLSANYYISPAFITSVFGGFKKYIYDPAFINKAEIGLGITYNFTKGIFGSSSIDVNDYSTEPLFPIFYSRYDNHKFGNIVFQNHEKNDITNVKVTIFIEQYMGNPNVIAEYPLIKRGEEFSADLTAFLNETIMNLLQNQLVDAKIEVTYSSLGKKMSKSQTINLQTLTRNSMSWEDDKRAAAFVSGHDASAQLFAARVEAIIRNSLRTDIPKNIQYAAALFGALKAYGINYVIDPSSAFTDNIGTSSVDFLQFPYQTILYHGGDCDDLSILNCSLLEALGVETAFITVPGHIYMAFEAGVPVEDASKVNGGRTIVIDDKVWIPVEITVTQDTFGLALQTGYREWKKYENEAVLIPVAEAWKEYTPVSVPESDIMVQMPERSIIIKEFNNAMRYVK